MNLTAKVSRDNAIRRRFGLKKYSLPGIRKLLSLSTTNQGVLLQMNVWIRDLKRCKKDIKHVCLFLHSL